MPTGFPPSSPYTPACDGTRPPGDHAALAVRRRCPKGRTGFAERGAPEVAGDADPDSGHSAVGDAPPASPGPRATASVRSGSCCTAGQAPVRPAWLFGPPLTAREPL